jgi:hypothetical protein
MEMSVSITSSLYEQAKAHAPTEHRTIAGQIEFWAMVGKAGLENPELPIQFVRDLLLAKAEDRRLVSGFNCQG